MDLDSQFKLPEDVFGLAFLLGVLYHLKNPFYVLEALAKHARYCVLSTRIAQRTPKGVPMKDEALAYFLAPRETNNDITNYWIFSETALQRLFERTGWIVRDFKTVGATRNSEPARLDRDERAFCLLESRSCPRYFVQLEQGWHALEQRCFRWTERSFSVQLRRPDVLQPTKLRFDFVLKFPGPVTVSATVNGVGVEPATFVEEGQHSYNIRAAARGHPKLSSARRLHHRQVASRRFVRGSRAGPGGGLLEAGPRPRRPDRPVHPQLGRRGI